MTGLFLFSAAAGVPLVLWFLFAGGSDDGGDGGAAEDGIGGLMLRLLPLSTLALAAATFGVTGLLVDAVSSSRRTTLVAAALTAVLAGVLNSTVFAFIRRSDSNASVTDTELVGAMGRVVLPVSPDRRGRVALSVGGQQVQMSARPADVPANTSELEVGAAVLVVEVHQGVATVVRLDAELT